MEPCHRANNVKFACGANCQRDAFVDGWRGLFHLILMMDHLPFLIPLASGVLIQWFEPLGYLSVAEGFVFLSGFVSGLVYTRVWRQYGHLAVWRKVLRRICVIYICYVSAVVLLVALVKYCGSSSVQWGNWQNLLNMPLAMVVTKVVFLVYQPNFLEILPMYCFFLLSVPATIRELEKGRYLEIGIISILTWLVAQFGIRDALVGLLSPYVPVQTGYFNSFGWQIVFVLGLLCGHKSFACRAAWLPSGWRSVTFVYIICIVLFALRHQIIPVGIWPPLVDRSSIGPLRFLNFACISFLLASQRASLQKYVSWPGLAFLSRHSLQVFAFHLIPIYIAALALSKAARFSLSGQWQMAFGFGGATPLSLTFQYLILAFCLGSLFIIAYLAYFWKSILKILLARWQNCHFSL